MKFGVLAKLAATATVVALASQLALLPSGEAEAAAPGYGNISLSWSIPNAPTGGLTNITYPITVNSETAHQRGIYFDKQSQAEIVQSYERIGNVERMSDSGDAVYVRKTV